MSGQDDKSRDVNRRFFVDEHSDYRRMVEGLASYRLIRDAVNEELRGIDDLLDVGNGGTFDYDVALVDKVVAVDLYLEDLPPAEFPANVVPRNGDALDLVDDDGSYDGVLMAMLFHHLSGERHTAVADNAGRALDEAHRVLRPGGRLIVVESCVPRWFHRFEQMAYPALRAVAGMSFLKHPPVLQLPSAHVAGLIEARFGSVRTRRIPTGALLLQFGHRWPTALTPARPWCFVAEKA
jgi:SAM-dependent methyltransferase